MYKLQGEKRKTEILRKKFEFVKKTRDFFLERNFTEVETLYLRRYPNLDPNVYMFEVENHFLHTSPEYGMKKLLYMGFDSIFQICKVFRKEYEDRLHSCEFTMLEWYKKNKDYKWLIEFSKELIRFLFNREIRFEVIELDVIFEEVFGKALEELHEKNELAKFAKSLGYKISEHDKNDTIFLMLYVDKIEPLISEKEAVFVVDFPEYLSPMAKRHTKKPFLCERVELIMKGIEIMNGYTELTDPNEQFERLKDIAISQNIDPEKYIDMELIQNLSRIGSAAGASIGIERLFMVKENIMDIRDCLAV